jgi:hypothetical protein
MHRVELRGGYQEMGRQQGTPLQGWDLGAPEPKALRFAKQCEEQIGRYAPELLEEIRGVATAADLDYDALLTFTITIPFDPAEIPTGSCTVLAVLPEHTADGRTIVGRNYDYFYDESEEGATTFCTYPMGRFASIGNCDIWVGREDGLNEAGLFVGQAAFFMPGLQPGFTFWFILRLLLDRCRTVEEGLELLHQIPHAASWTYLLADRFGQAAVVEPTIEGIEVRYPEDGLLVLTNHAVCPRWAGKEAFVPPDSHPRYNRLRQLLGGGGPSAQQRGKGIDIHDVKLALRDHEGLVCSHGEHFDRKFGTLWSVVGRPGERHLEIAAGSPCQTEYQTVSF